jgi:hypothetical protein
MEISTSSALSQGHLKKNEQKLRVLLCALCMFLYLNGIVLGNVGCDRERSAIELVDEETVTTMKLFGSAADGICEVDGLLVGKEYLEGEGYGLLTG